MKRLSSLSVLVLIPAMLLSGCASISVCKIKPAANQPFAVPKKIYVREFTGPESVFRVDRKGDSLTEFKTKTSKQLSDDLVKKLNESVMPAEAIAANSHPPKGNYWLVTGTFERVNQGSKMLRMLIGLGSGGTKIETTVRVFECTSGKEIELLNFRTSGGSNIEPGPGILTGGPPDPIDATITILWTNGLTGLTKDITRTAKEIAAEISDYLSRHGVKPKDPKLKVKLMRGPKA